MNTQKLNSNRKDEMNITLKTLIGATCIAMSSAAYAQTQERVQFYTGDNSGALAIATEFYELTNENVETSIIDIDSNGSAEVSVRFLDQCIDNLKCPTTVLFYSDNQWLEIYSEITEYIELDKSFGDVARISSSNGLTWSWYMDKYIGRVSESTIIWDAAEKVELESSFSMIDEIRRAESAIQYNIDLDSNGTLEKIVLVTDGLTCNGFGRCDGFVFTNNNRFAGKVFHYRGELFVRERGSQLDLIVNHPASFVIYAYREPNIFITDTINAMPVRTK